MGLPNWHDNCSLAVHKCLKLIFLNWKTFTSLCIDVTIVGRSRHVTAVKYLELPYHCDVKYTNCTTSVGSNHCFQAIGTRITKSNFKWSMDMDLYMFS